MDSGIRFCPLCEKESIFNPFSDKASQRPYAQCPNCHSLERDRFAWLFIQHILRPDPKTRYLNIGADKPLVDRLRPILKENLITAGLEDDVDIISDLTCLTFEDQAFDVVYCSHVLEHIRHDRIAIKEIARVLDLYGMAIIIVPIKSGKTVECLDDLSPEERKRLFGHWDHWRIYGDDFEYRLLECGLWSLKIRREDLEIPISEFERFGITEETGYLFQCHRKFD